MKYAKLDDNGNVIATIHSNKPITDPDYVAFNLSNSEIFGKQHNGVSFVDKPSLDANIALVVTQTEYVLNDTITGTVETNPQVTGDIFVTFVDLSQSNAMLCKCQLSNGKGTWTMKATQQGIFIATNNIETSLINVFTVNQLKIIVTG